MLDIQGTVPRRVSLAAATNELIALHLRDGLAPPICRHLGENMAVVDQTLFSTITSLKSSPPH
jgi:hypothetical protein